MLEHLRQDRGEMIGSMLESLFDDSLFTDAYDRLKDGQVQEGMEKLVKDLYDRRIDSSDQEWVEFVGVCMQHPLKDLLHQDPFTYRAFSKPRGYAGDAELMDMIYSHEDEGLRRLPAGTTDLGRQIFEFYTLKEAPEGVRARRESIAHLLDDVAEDNHKPHVLSIAAGHLREALHSSAVKRKRFGRFIALDSDTESLEEVQRSYGKYNVEIVPATIRQLLSKKLDLGQFDLIYSTGLYDYLQQPIAQRLTSSMFQMLKPRGRLRVANFLPGIPDLGYMESFMDWKLIYRTAPEMVDVAATIPQHEIRDMRIFREDNQNIIFLDITKK